MRHGRWTGLALLAIVALVASACSSSTTREEAPGIEAADTGPTASASPSSAPTGDDRPADEGTDPGAGSTRADEPGEPADATSEPGADTEGADTGGDQPATSSPSAPSEPATADPEPGLSGEPLKVGFTVFDPSGVNAMTGTEDNVYSDADSDQEPARLRKEIEALIEYANDTGGVHGQPLEAVKITFDAGDISQERRLAKCVSATEDHGVVAYIDNNGFFTEADWACFADHEVTYVGWAQHTDRRFLEEHAPYITTTHPAADRIAIALVDGLRDSGYFDGATLGLLLDDRPTVRHIYENVMLPRLRAAGAEPAEVAYISPTDQAQQSAQAQSAVLRFQQAGVTHVTMLTNVLGYLSFSNSAESQNYSPRYGFGDYQLLVSGAPNFDQSGQLDDAVGVSSNVPTFVDPEDARVRETGDPVNFDELGPGAPRCVEVLSKYRGEDYRDSPNRSTRWTWYCEHFFLWLDAVRAGPAPFSPANFASGLSALEGRYLPTMLDANRYAPGVHDGGSTYQVGIFSEVEGCRCYHPVTPWRPLPR